MFCAWTLTLQPRPLLFCPPHVHLQQRQEPALFHLLPRQQLRFFGFQLRFLRAFGDFSNGLVSPLSALVEDEDASFFALESSLTAIWVPCVVGKKPRMFLVIALFSRLVWALAVVATLFLCKSNFPDFLQKRTIVLFFAPNATWAYFKETNSTSICPSFDECLDICTNSVT